MMFLFYAESMNILNKIYQFIRIAKEYPDINKIIHIYKNLEKSEKYKDIFHINSMLEIRLFNKNMHELACKIKNSYILSSVNIDKQTGKYSFKKLGVMRGFPELVKTADYYPDMSFYNSFYVQRLNAEELRKGTGRKLIHLARCESRRYECKGLLHLDAVNPENPPFYFYRSLGFDSQDKYQIDCIDKLMQKKIPLPSNYRHWCISMYLPKSKTGMQI